MRRWAVLALTFWLLIALPLATTAAERDEDPPLPQRVELPDIGLAASFPAAWRVMTPMMPRASWFDRSVDDVTPVYAWTGVFATAGDGRWCGIDRFEDFPWSLAEHASFLERWHVSASLYGRDGGMEAIELPGGTAYRIDIDDALMGRSSRIYLLEYGTDRVLLTCSDVLGSAEDWLAIAMSLELGPRTASAPDTITAMLDARAAK